MITVWMAILSNLHFHDCVLHSIPTFLLNLIDYRDFELILSLTDFQ